MGIFPTENDSVGIIPTSSSFPGAPGRGAARESDNTLAPVAFGFLVLVSGIGLVVSLVNTDRSGRVQGKTRSRATNQLRGRLRPGPMTLIPGISSRVRPPCFVLFGRLTDRNHGNIMRIRVSSDATAKELIIESTSSMIPVPVQDPRHGSDR